MALQLIKVLASFRSFLHSFQFISGANWLLIPNILAAFLTSSLHLVCVIPTSLSPSGCIYVSLLGIEISSILATWPAYHSLAILISTGCLGCFKRLLSFVLNLYLSWSVFFVAFSFWAHPLFFSSVWDNVQHCMPYSITGHTKVFYNEIFVPDIHLANKILPFFCSLLLILMPVLGHVTVPADPKKRSVLFGLNERPYVSKLLADFMLDMLLLPYG